MYNVCNVESLITRITEIILDWHGPVLDSLRLKMNSLFYLKLKTGSGMYDPKHGNNVLKSKAPQCSEFLRCLKMWETLILAIHAPSHVWKNVWMFAHVTGITAPNMQTYQTMFFFLLRSVYMFAGFVPFFRNKFPGLFQDFFRTFPRLRLIFQGLKNPH